MSAVEILVEVVGWGGALLILGGYYLLSAGRVTGRSMLYQSMNVAGAAGFVLYGWWHGAVATAALNIVWMMIGIFTLWQIIGKKGSSTSAT